MKTGYSLIPQCLFLLFTLSTDKLDAQTTAGKINADTLPLLQRIQCLTDIQENCLSKDYQDNWFNALEPIADCRFIYPLLKHSKNGTLKVYDPLNPDKIQLSNLKVIDIVSPKSESIVEDPETGVSKKVITRNEVSWDQIHKIQFDEIWKFNSSTLQFTKEVKGIFLIKTDYNYDGSGRKDKLMYYIPFKPVTNKIMTESDLLAGIVVPDSRINYSTKENETVADTSNAQFLSPHAKKIFIGTLFDGVMQGKIAAYSAEYPFNKKLNKTEIDEICKRKNIVVSTDEYSADRRDTFISRGDLRLEEINDVRFNETWYYDANKPSLMKKVKGVMLMRTLYNSNSGTSTSVALFYIALNKPDQEVVNSIVHIDRTENNVNVLFNSDSARKISEIDTAAYSTFIKLMLNDVKTGKQKALDPNASSFNEDSEVRYKQLSAAELNAICYSKDKIEVLDPQTGNYNLKVIVKPIDLKKISALAFNESWDFDSAKMRFTKDVKGIYPLLEMSDQAGDLRGYKQLFYIPLNHIENIIKGKSLGTEVSYSALLKGIDCTTNPADEINYGFDWKNYIETSKRMGIIKTLLDGVENGKIKGYAPDNLHRRELKQNELNKLLTGITWKDINMLTFFESWSYDEDSQTFHKKVSGLMIGTGDVKTGLANRWYFYVKLNE